ncbi:MAG: 30S ribosomal protein S13 [Candidatus Woesebacteria bacterium]|nr:30S ribosomal protein S13 [Candidatus Woesebacteria bacterium]
MARIAGIELNDNWRIDFGLTRIKGIGWSLSRKLLDSIKFDHAKRIKDITPDEMNKISGKIEEFPTEGDLVRRVKADINRLQTIGSYRGMRHTKGLPTRGQRTKTNARTKRGKRKTVGAFKKEALVKATVAKK